jgi:hypothetical protein
MCLAMLQVLILIILVLGVYWGGGGQKRFHFAVRGRRGARAETVDDCVEGGRKLSWDMIGA